MDGFWVSLVPKRIPVDHFPIKHREFLGVHYKLSFARIFHPRFDMNWGAAQGPFFISDHQAVTRDDYRRFIFRRDWEIIRLANEFLLKVKRHNFSRSLAFVDRLEDPTGQGWLWGWHSFFPVNLSKYPRSLDIDDSLSVEQGSVSSFFGSVRRTVRFNRLPYKYASRNKPDKYQQSCVEREPALCSHILVGLICVGVWIWGGRRIVDCHGYRRDMGIVAVIVGAIGLLCTMSSFALGSPLAIFRLRWLYGEDDCNNHQPSHNGTIVLQKYLDKLYYCSTVIDMANVLSRDKQIAVVSALAEGSSIRSIERVTGINRNTIMNLGVRVGRGCTALLDVKMRDLPCRYLQFDEVWGFIGKKERHLQPGDDPQYGDVWTFCAIDADTKLVPSFKCGKRDLATAKAFVEDVASRMRMRVQISTDALRAYSESIEQVYGIDVDYGQIVKTYEHDDAQNAERKYSAARFVSVEKRSVTGSPDMDEVSTSYIERLNATTRLHMKRLSRLTLAFSKKFENFEAAVGLHFAYYNLVKRHGSLRMTPAMAAGIERDFWSVGDLVEAAA